jgi:AcrR family transcriptional regulator
MPRPPDADLEERIVAAAMRLLDRGGGPAITLRAVAKEAGTTTPTIYQRFEDREVLMNRVIERVTDSVVAVLQRTTSVEGLVREYLRDCLEHPMRLELSVHTFGRRYVAGEAMPAFELLQSRITEDIGIKGRDCEDLALAIAALAFGTAQGMAAAAANRKHVQQIEASALRALRMLVAAFSGGGTSRARPVPLRNKKISRSR